MKRLFLFIPALLLLAACNQPEIGTDVRETYFVRTEGADMPVYVRGNTQSNRFLLVVHGGPGGEAYSYTVGRFADQISQEHAILAWDQRGQGASQGHYSEEILTIERMRLDLKAVILATRERYGAEAKIYVMGHSWGGLLGTAFAQSEDQTLMDGWIEVAGAHDLPLLYTSARTMLDTFADQELLLGRDVDFWQEVKDTLAVLPLADPTVDDFLSLNALGHNGTQTYPDIERIEESEEESSVTLMDAVFRNPLDELALITSTAQTGQVLLEEVVQTNLSNTMDQIQVPTLLLWGRYDFVVPPALAEDAFPKIGTNDKEIWYFEQSGHSPMVNEADAFFTVVSDWIGRH